MGRPRIEKSETPTQERNRIAKQRERNTGEVLGILCRAYSHSTKYGHVSTPNPTYLRMVGDIFMPKRFKEKLEKLTEFTSLIRTELTIAYYQYADGSYKYNLSVEEREKAKEESDFIANLMWKWANGTLEPLPSGYGGGYVLPLDDFESDRNNE